MKKSDNKVKKTIRIIVVDDHAIFRQGLRELIENEKDMKIVSEASDDKQAMEFVKKQKPDIVLMDINLSGIDGTELTRRLRKQFPEVKVIILSMYDDEAHILEAVKAGALGYVVKTETADNLIKTIRVLVNKGVALSADIMPRFLEAIRKIEPESLNAQKIRLTKREIELLDALAKGFSNKEIANKFHSSEKTVKNQLNLLFNKMGVENRTKAVVTAIQKKIISVD